VILTFEVELYEILLLSPGLDFIINGFTHSGLGSVTGHMLN